MKDLSHSVAPDPEGPDDLPEDWVRIRRRNRPQRDTAPVSNPVMRDPEPAKAPVAGADRPRTAEPATPPADLGRIALVPPASRPIRPERPIVIEPEPQPDVWDTLLRIEDPRVLSALASSANGYGAEALTQGFDLLRTRLMQTMRSHGWHRLAVATPRHGGGATFTAVNLALSLSKVPGSRTVLMDLNQRSPGVAPALGLRQHGSIHRFLKGEVALEDHLVRASDSLVLGLTDAPFAQAAEVFHDPVAELVLEDMFEALRPDLVIYDLPPALEYDDLAAVLPLVDGVLLVSDGTETTAADIAACERILEGQAPLLGVVLNRARSTGKRKGWF